MNNRMVIPGKKNRNNSSEIGFSQISRLLFLVVFIFSSMGARPVPVVQADSGRPVHNAVSADGNEAPVISGDDPVAVSMSEDGSPDAFSLTLDATGANADDTFSWTVSTPAVHGTATAEGNSVSQVVEYTPDANYSGPDSFVVQVSDGNGGSAAVTVNVDIAPVNDAPVCVDAALTTTQDTAGDVAPSCSDVDGDPLSYTIVDGATQGEVSIVSGMLDYVPGTGYTGSDSFTYKASDGNLDSNTAMVTVTVTAVKSEAPVNNAPVCVDVALTTTQDTAGDVVPSCSDVDGDPLSYSIVDGATQGEASIVSEMLDYVPGAGYTGSDSLHLQSQRRQFGQQYCYSGCYSVSRFHQGTSRNPFSTCQHYVLCGQHESYVYVL